MWWRRARLWVRIKFWAGWLVRALTLSTWVKTFWEDLPDHLIKWDTWDFGFTLSRTGWLFISIILTGLLVGHFVRYRWPVIRGKRIANSPGERLHTLLPLLEIILVDIEKGTIDESLMVELVIRAKELGIGINATGAGRRLNLSQDLPHLIACARTKSIKEARSYNYSYGAEIRLKPDQDHGVEYEFRPTHAKDEEK